LKVVKIDNQNGLGVKDDPGLVEYLFGSNFPGWVVEHAAIWETSGMMAAYTELVRKEAIIKVIEEAFGQVYFYMEGVYSDEYID